MASLHHLWWTFVRRFFHLLYGPFSWTYDGVAWLVSLGQWTAWGRVALPHLKGPPVLELAHGPGHLLVTMACRGLTPVGLDLSPQMGRVARRRLLRSSLPVRLVRARAQALPFGDGSFPSIVATFPTEFILDPRTVREVVRVLSPEGTVAVVAGARLTGRDPLSAFLEWLYRVTGQRKPLPRGDETAWGHSGLTLRTEWVPVGRSRVLLVLGRRTASGSSTSST
ncbi:MAG TPA: class I SAM-dependent methyltransferase [Anaerolineales bacterium]|nr:class I SAM-dependent methyltransferase [Anaerolineae bacterium]HIQ01448.1 class I SAM-dependent methyltransferase [Anaerolineales bacterium]